VEYLGINSSLQGYVDTGGAPSFDCGAGEHTVGTTAYFGDLEGPGGEQFFSTFYGWNGFVCQPGGCGGGGGSSSCLSQEIYDVVGFSFGAYPMLSPSAEFSTLIRPHNSSAAHYVIAKGRVNCVPPGLLSQPTKLNGYLLPGTFVGNNNTNYALVSLCGAVRACLVTLWKAHKLLLSPCVACSESN
jgi:hypothetical protein